MQLNLVAHFEKTGIGKMSFYKERKKIGCFRSRPFWQGQKDSFSSLDARRSGRLYRAKGHGIHCRPILVLLQEANKKIGCLCNRPFWQGQKDSNPQQRFWRPTCYHYTMPLCGSSGIAGTRFSLALFRAFVKRFCENCSELAENRPVLYKTRGAWYDEGRKVGGRDARAVGGTGSGVCADAWRGVHAAPRG